MAMITYLKNIEGWKHKDLKSKDFNCIKELFDKAFKRGNMFVDYRTDLVEGSSKRAGDELEQEVTKKQKVDDVQETAKVDDDQEAAKIKAHYIFFFFKKLYHDEEENYNCQYKVTTARQSICLEELLLLVKVKTAQRLRRKAAKCGTLCEERETSTRFVGPLEIIEKVGPVAYRLDLPEELDGVHDTFHMPNLKKFWLI
ncbi:hypothetical protein Tco_0820784 [Tanacetum coccineum]|uniref:Tf2-1-like SH3-like domain-containing protein n=1 Tax=Tanacetum coccineum TaxID=301880 RepID=A0ABQ5AAE1_9ASTR